MPVKKKVNRKDDSEKKSNKGKPKSAGNGITGNIKPKKKKMY